MKKTLFLLLALPGLALAEDSQASYTLGDVMYVGDSITHGVNSASYRWQMHKILVDNGVYYNEVGYHSGNDGGYTLSNSTYGGVEFENKHSANSSQRTYHTAGRTSGGKMDGTNIKNWLGLSETTNNGAAYTGSVSEPDTFVMLLGTNDLLSDKKDNLTAENLETVTTNLLGAKDEQGKRTGGDMGTIVGAMYEANSAAKVYVSAVPCWTEHLNNNGKQEHNAVKQYNESLKQWVADYNTANSTNVVLVDVNRGLLDVAVSSSESTPFAGVRNMFNNPGTSGDGLHPNAQGDLIIAGNMARAMGYGGRTAGLERVGAGQLANTVAAPTLETVQSWGDVTPTGGFTAELCGFSLGNGAADGWNTTDNFTLTIGNGSLSGTLAINEAYIQWGSDVLFSLDMSTLTASSENIRMAYHTGDTTQGIDAGFYVWLGDMLIGEALTATATGETVNGVTLSSANSSYTLGSLAWDGTGAYAPTTTLASYALTLAPAATPQGKIEVPTTGVTHTATITTDTGGGNAMSQLSPATGTDATSVVVATVDSGDIDTYFANSGARTVKDIWVTVNSGKIGNGWYAAHKNKTLTGNVNLIFAKDFEGMKPYDKNKSGGSVFGVLQGKVDGNVTLQFDAANAVYTSFTDGNAASVIGSYESDITGTFKAVINAGTFNYDILGGIHKSSLTDDIQTSSIGATEIYVNGGTIEGDVYGGGIQGSITNDTAVTISGGTIEENVFGGGKGDTIGGDTSVTICGGTIKKNVYAGGSLGTIKGNTSLVIDGNLASIGGNTISAGGSGGTIKGNSSLTIKNATTNTYIGSIDKFTGTLSGGDNVTGTSSLIFDNTQLKDCSFEGVTVSDFNSISLSNGSDVAVGSVSLDGAGGSTISLTEDSHLFVKGNFSSASGLSITGGSGSVSLAGATNSFGGGISVAEGNTLTLSGNLEFEIQGGNFDASYEYYTDRTTNGLGSVQVTVSGLQNLLSGEIITTGVERVTVNGSVVNIEALESATSTYTMENVYCVVDSTVEDAPATPTAPREKGAVYSLGNGKEILESSVVNVGTHNLSAPKATEGANEALGYYVGGDGTLCIMADVSPTKTAGQILQSVQGDGNIILRTAGYENPDGSLPLMHVYVDGKTQVTGELYLAPYYVGASGGSMNFQPGVILELQEGADISSFSEVHYCYPQSQIVVNGQIGANEAGAHIKNLTAKGCGTVLFAVDAGANDSLVLGGDTSLGWYEHGSGGKQGVTLHVDINHANSHLTIESLTGGVQLEGSYRTISSVSFTTSEYDFYSTSVDSVKSVVDIDSFDYRGNIYLKSINERDSISLNINLKSEQYIQDSQLTWTLAISDSVYNGSVDVTLTGSGRYVLSDGNAIYMGPSKDFSGEFQKNFAKLSDDWIGTVEVNNLNATGGNTKIQGIKIADYGNENSTIHFKGFKGYLTDSDTEVEIKSDLIIADGESLKGYEISGGAADQKQTYTGAISGTGDFVVSAADTKNINVEGSINEWTGNISVTNGTHNICLANDAEAVTVNGTISNANDDSAINLTVDTALGTTFKKSVDVTSLTVSSGSVANLQATTTAGNVQVDCRGGIAAKLSNGLTIEESSVSSGAIADAKITARDITKTVELADLEATNLYLYGKDVSFHSAEDEKQFEYEPMTYDLPTANEVVYTTDIFKGMTLSKDGAQLTLSVLDAVVGTGDPGADMTNVTIFLEGFTIEELAGTSGKWSWKKQANTSGDWSWTEHGLTLLAADSQVALMSADPSVTVTDLLNAQYKFVTYKQNPQGLTIRMSNIPEPATATLSLLALAALAARRRRK